MVYTCYEMIGDCRAAKPEGWRYFISSYIPVMRTLAAHYNPGSDGDRLIERVLTEIRRPAHPLFASLDPAPERWFIARLRQTMLVEISAAEPEMEVSLETVAEALAPLTLTQKLAAWLEAMGYDAAAAGAMLRMAPATVEKARVQAGEALRGKIDNWSRTLLTENGRRLGNAAAGASTKDCVGPKVFLDVLDGRATWQGREEMERHAGACWHCIDHFARMAEVIELLRGLKPLDDSEAAPWLKAIGVSQPRKSFWKRP